MRLRKAIGWLALILGFVFVVRGILFFSEGKTFWFGLKLLQGIDDVLESFIIGIALIAFGWLLKK